MGVGDDDELDPRMHTPGLVHVVGCIACLYAFICGILSFYLGLFAITLCVIVALCVAMLATEYVERRHPVAPWLMLLGGSVTVVAAFVGVMNYHHCFAPYLAAAAGRQYDSVPASGPASAYADGGVLHFASDVVLDGTRSVGLRSRGSTFCAAPVLGKKSSVAAIPIVQFWAVGTDCCASRGGFVCGSAGEPDVHSGLVLPNPEDTVTSTVFAPKTHYTEYLRAVAASSALHDLGVPEAPVLVMWESQPETLLLQGPRPAITYLLTSTAIAVLFSACVWQPVRRRCEDKIKHAAAFGPQDAQAQATASATGGGAATTTQRPPQDPFLMGDGGRGV